MREARNTASVRTVYEGYKNNYFQPPTPQGQTRTLGNGKLKGSPQNCDRVLNRARLSSQDYPEDTDRSFADIIRETENIPNRDSGGNYLSTAFHSSSKDTSQSTVQGLNSIHISLKSRTPLNGITREGCLKTSSSSELTSLVKSDANFNTRMKCKHDVNTEPNEHCFETDSLLVRCGSTGQTCKRFTRCLDKEHCVSTNGLQNGQEELTVLNENDNIKTNESTLVTMNSVM